MRVEFFNSIKWRQVANFVAHVARERRRRGHVEQASAIKNAIEYQSKWLIMAKRAGLPRFQAQAQAQAQHQPLLRLRNY